MTSERTRSLSMTFLVKPLVTTNEGLKRDVARRERYHQRFFIDIFEGTGNGEKEKNQNGKPSKRSQIRKEKK